MVSKGFEDLIVWQKAKDLAVEVYKTSKNFPREEIYGMTSQIRRCSASIASNIAEGTTYSSKKQFLHFLQIAHGSCAELRTHLTIANEVGLVENENYKQLTDKILEIGRMLKGLERSQTEL